MKAHFQFFALLVLICSLPVAAFGQKLSKYYSSRNQEGGNIYFIYPFEDFKNKADGSDFVFDVTHRVGTDFAIINFSYFSIDPLPADSLKISASQVLVSEKAEKLFIDFDKKLWQHRYSIKINFSDLTAIFKTQSQPAIEVISDRIKLVYVVKEKDWKRYADAVNKILYIIKSESE
jgi:hypothetical protein